MSFDGREMPISYGIEAQLNKKASKITRRETSFFFLWVKGLYKARPTKAKYMQQLQHVISFALRSRHIKFSNSSSAFLIQLQKDLCSFWL